MLQIVSLVLTGRIIRQVPLVLREKKFICTLFYAYNTPISDSLAQSVLAQPVSLAGSHASALNSPQQITVAEHSRRHSIRVQ